MKNLIPLILAVIMLPLSVACEGDWFGMETPPGPDSSEDSLSVKPIILRDGTKEHPFLPGDFSENSELFHYYSASSDELWVEGYIVGYLSGSRMSTVVFEAGSKESNIVLGDAQESPEYLMPVQLATSSEDSKDVRSALNLMYNPSNLGRHVLVAGTLGSYMSSIGLKPATAYAWVE